MAEDPDAIRNRGSGMTVARLLARAGITAAGAAVESRVLHAPVSGIFYDSRRVAAGGVFVAVPGERFDGARFVADAGGRGAVLAVGQGEEPAVAAVPWLRVPDARAALASLAAAFHGDPSHDLLVVGVTGTNGKTTTTYLIESMLEHAGMTAGRISSISSRIARDHGEQPASRTTPEAPDVQALLGAMRGHGQRACVLEVSSHALALRRVDRVRFAAGVFTNLTRDHLDFHGDMARYYAAKRRLFEMLPERAPAILNVDDPHGARLAGSVRRPVTYALHRSADVVASRLDLSGDGVRMEVRTPRGTLHLQSSLLGRANAYNLLAAAAAGVALDIPFRDIEEGLRSVVGVPGRLQTVSNHRDDVTVIVDYAHTDDALRRVLETARLLARGRVITVFGCGGDRDAAKRPLMGAAAAWLSDFVVITSDNPRSEDPLAIIADVERGLAQSQTPHRSIADREAAIVRAIGEAEPGDMVVIAGKGHEQEQVVGSQVLPFEDAAVARAALAARRNGARVG